MALLLLASALAVFPSHQSVISTPRSSSWDLGNGFQLTKSLPGIQITDQGQSVWSASLPFLSASGGNDLVIGSSGAFNITQVDINTCQEQSISSIQSIPWEGTITDSAVRVSGDLLNCGGTDAPYTATFWVPDNLADRVAFYLDVTPPSYGS